MVVKFPVRLLHEQLSPSAITELQGTPWCSKLLSDPALQPINLDNRTIKSDTHDSLTSETLHSPNSIKAWQSFYKPDAAESRSSFGEYLFVLSLGSGLNGHAHTLHGGTSALLMDEAMTQVSRQHMSPNTVTLTATMTVNYKKRVPTPGVVLCRAWLEERSGGRKHWVRGTLEDGEGTVFVEATALCLEVPEHLTSKL